ncbi:MAG: hypothetical protein M3P96_07725 [Actinomycetota bacterium]|nr:hypothetical protein [Actinomycetota bacterium]
MADVATRTSIVHLTRPHTWAAPGAARSGAFAECRTCAEHPPTRAGIAFGALMFAYALTVAVVLVAAMLWTALPGS